MCGIIGYLGKREALGILQKGLARLEYRGYDSAGIAIVENGNLELVKMPGKVEALNKILERNHIPGHLGIGHTRWATHGEVNQCNAHPHLDCKGEIILVHNGIIENYQGLKTKLQETGHCFSSDTDSEVIAHLVEENYQGDLERAVMKVLPQLEGSFALLIVCKQEPGKIVAARSLSPLVFGIGEDGYYLASDVTALLEETRVVIYLEDGELVVVERDGFQIKDFKGRSISKNRVKVNWDISWASKNGYPHFMLKEIHEQPEVIKRILSLYLAQDRIELGIADELWKELEHIYLVACGTAYHAALIGAYFLESLARVPVRVDTSSEFRYRNPVIEKNTLFLCISQSGETADTLASLRLAKALGMRTLAIVNVEGSTIAREAEKVIYTNAGPEIGVASTKAYLSQLLVLKLLSLKLAELRAGESADFIKCSLLELKKLPIYLERLLEEKNRIQQLAQELSTASNFLYLGRGINFPNALEGALKLKEISYIHAEGYPAGEMKHGPIALIEEDLPVVALAPKGKVRSKMLSNILEVKSRRGRVIGLITQGDEELKSACRDSILLPEVREEVAAILIPLPLQLLAYYLAVERGCDVDRPRNLAKSVTVE